MGTSISIRRNMQLVRRGIPLCTRQRLEGKTSHSNEVLADVVYIWQTIPLVDAVRPYYVGLSFVTCKAGQN